MIACIVFWQSTFASRRINVEAVVNNSLSRAKKSERSIQHDLLNMICIAAVWPCSSARNRLTSFWYIDSTEPSATRPSIFSKNRPVEAKAGTSRSWIRSSKLSDYTLLQLFEVRPSENHCRPRDLGLALMLPRGFEFSGELTILGARRAILQSSGNCSNQLDTRDKVPYQDAKWKDHDGKITISLVLVVSVQLLGVDRVAISSSAFHHLTSVYYKALEPLTVRRSSHSELSAQHLVWQVLVVLLFRGKLIKYARCRIRYSALDLSP